jgi:predicted small secreted protein
MTRIPTIIASFLAASIAASALSACNTVEGVGQDIKSAGKSLEKAAEEMRKDDKKK